MEYIEHCAIDCMNRHFSAQNSIDGYTLEYYAKRKQIKDEDLFYDLVITAQDEQRVIIGEDMEQKQRQVKRSNSARPTKR